MNVNSMLLARRGNLPRPVAEWNFSDFSKIQPGAGANDVEGWTGENLKAGLATVDLEQLTPANQTTFNTDHIELDGSDYLEGLPAQTGDFTYIIKLSTTSSSVQVILGNSSTITSVLYISGSGNLLRVIPTSGVDHQWNVSAMLGINLSDGVSRVITLTRSGNNYTGYIDDVSLGAKVDAADFIPDWLGNWQSDSIQFDGNMYNALIYPTALNAVEIAAKTASLA